MLFVVAITNNSRIYRITGDTYEDIHFLGIKPKRYWPSSYAEVAQSNQTAIDLTRMFTAIIPISS